MTKTQSHECILNLNFKSHMCHRLQKRTISVLLYNVSCTSTAGTNTVTNSFFSLKYTVIFSGI